MPLNEKEKHALTEKYKQQRQSMWAGERTPSEEKDPPSQTQPQPPETESEATDAGSQEPTATEEAPVGARHASPLQPSRVKRQRREPGKAERAFWEDNPKQPSALTWKIAVGVITAVIGLICVGVLIGYWFAS